MTLLPLRPGPLHGAAPLRLWGAQAARETAGTHYGVVVEGPVHLGCDAGDYVLGAGMVFCVPGALRLEGGLSWVVSDAAARGFFQICGPIEAVGRLRYIDGCTDSLLIPPPLRGEPCLNHLHFPPATDQTLHTHPSVRVGLVLRGEGWCKAPEGELPLRAGLAFWLPAETRHAFRTGALPMDVVAFHPDSDFGPTHDDHPMINRTLVDGVSARHIDAIRTR